MLYFLYVNDPGLRSGNYIVLEYSHTLIYTISCLHLLSFRSKAAIISENHIDFTFSCVCSTVSSMLSGLETRSLGLNTLGTT